MLRARLKLAGLVLVGLTAITRASQNPPPQPPPGQEPQVFRAGAQTEVPIYATVVDANGRLVPDLERGDFIVTDDGRPVELTQFSNASQPFTSVVMLDTSASMTNNLELLNRAAEQFLIRLMPTDRAQVGAFNDKTQLSGRLTNNRDELISALRELQFGNPTRLNDAIATSLDVLVKIDGRRVVLVFTDGDDTSSKIGFKTVLERARDEEVMVYAIGLESKFLGTTTKPDGGLRKLADETGGGYFELKKSAELGATFSRVAQELRSQYLLGFAPATLDNKLHKLDVRARAGHMVRARKSYTATPNRGTTSQ
jgi:Ca-activated chloride channel family protein